VRNHQLSYWDSGLIMVAGTTDSNLLRTTCAICSWWLRWDHLVVDVPKSLLVCRVASTYLTTCYRMRRIWRRSLSNWLPSSSTTSKMRLKLFASHSLWVLSSSSKLYKSNSYPPQPTLTTFSTCVTSQKCSKVSTWQRNKTKTLKSTWSNYGLTKCSEYSTIV